MQRLTRAAAGPITVERYVRGQLVERTEIPAPDGETIRDDFEKAKRGPKPKQQFGKGVERGEAAQRFESNPW